ncbi:MAG: acyltransferase [Opitutales bacterium]|nr:acyltransferase [Opitutales bacterium]
MNKFFANLLVAFIPNKTRRKALREKLAVKRIRMTPGNVVSIKGGITKNIHISGKGNHVLVKKTDSPLHLEISITGNNNEVIIEEGLRIESLCRIAIGTTPCPCNNAKIYIGKNTRINDVYFLLMEDNSTIEVGDDCLFSWGIYVWATDSHAIFEVPEKYPYNKFDELEEKNVKNKGHFIKIGNHVWVGMDVKIGKDTTIGDGSIIGWGSVVTKSFDQINCIIAGNPAKTVKHCRSWDLLSANMPL